MKKLLIKLFGLDKAVKAAFVEGFEMSKDRHERNRHVYHIHNGQHLKNIVEWTALWESPEAAWINSDAYMETLDDETA